MITRVEIENFQSHRRTTLEFSSGTNVVVGLSDSGKSSVLRAINWVLSNRPLGEAFRSEWGGDTSVVLHTSDGHIVERLRTDSENTYIVDGLSLRAFGTEPPEDVRNILRLDEFCIHGQMDPPFLLSCSPGEAARALNQAASLDDIDRVISNLRKTQATISRDLERETEQHSRLNAQLSQYDDVPELDGKLRHVEGQNRARAELEQRAVTLRALAQRGRVVEAQVNLLASVEQSSRSCERLLRQHAALLAHRRLLQTLSHLAARVRELEILLTQADGALRIAPSVTVAHQQAAAWANKAHRLRALEMIVKMIKSSVSALTSSGAKIEQMENAFSQLAPDICPLCGNRMKQYATHQGCS